MKLLVCLRTVCNVHISVEDSKYGNLFGFGPCFSDRFRIGSVSSSDLSQNPTFERCPKKGSYFNFWKEWTKRNKGGRDAGSVILQSIVQSIGIDIGTWWSSFVWILIGISSVILHIPVSPFYRRPSSAFYKDYPACKTKRARTFNFMLCSKCFLSN